MCESAKILYIVVADEKEKESFRYTRSVLQSTLQLMGCKARHAFKISKRVFEVTKGESTTGTPQPEAVTLSGTYTPSENSVDKDGKNAGFCLNKTELGDRLRRLAKEKNNSVPFESYKRRTTAFVPRETFLDIVCDAMSEYKYLGPNQRADLVLACRYAIVFKLIYEAY
ncbi:hypothetical protein PIB30_077042 [Stylosanthes scabra]|uniref:Uncharacterized protein n=1 Tax=Stylosanthes scabra TaxID=79078 RepID=A0ABU6SRP2_9FABA|nr:hypothetical protein [Stylosanthes scabra]